MIAVEHSALHIAAKPILPNYGTLHTISGRSACASCTNSPSCHGELVEAGPRRADPTASAFTARDGSVASGAQAVAAWLII